MPELLKTITANSSNLKAYYRFESGALTTDTQGTHTLTAISDPAEGTGKFGGGVDLDGDDAYSAIDHADLKPTGNFTVGAWVKYSSAGTTTMFTSYSQNTNVAGIRFFTSSGQIGLVSGKNNGTTAGTHYGQVYSITSHNDNAWHHAVATYDGVGLRMYVDGVYKATTAWTSGAVYAATNYVRVGARNNAGTNAEFFTGSLDDVFLINGTALSADQIKELYEGHVYGELRPNQFGTTAGLWHLNGNSTDFSGNNNHGTDTAITYSVANGKLGQGAGFNGSSSRINFTSNAGFTVTTLTMGCWVKFTSTAYQIFMHNAFFNGTNWYGIFMGTDASSGGKLFIYVGSGTGSDSDHTSALAINDDVWHFVVTTQSGATNKIYIDGSLRATKTTVTPGYHGSNSPALGARNVNGTWQTWYTGKMDEPFFCSSVLTDAQIRQLYAYQKGLLGRYA